MHVKQNVAEHRPTTPLWNELLAQLAIGLWDQAALDALPELPGVYAVCLA